MNLPISGQAREEMFRLLDEVSKNVLANAEVDLDAAVDAIGAVLQAEPMQKVLDNTLDTHYWIDDDDDPTEMFGSDGISSVKGYFVAVSE